MTSSFYKIEIDGKQFNNDYLVYIIKLSTELYGNYFYVGQTGDRNYLIARPAFRRLAGHFSDQGHSTENQIYRQIAVKILNITKAKERKVFDAEIKESVTEFLTKCKIEMFVHPIAKFSITTNIENHIINRKLTEDIENELINYLIQEYGIDKVLNKKYTLTNSKKRQNIVQEIINHINK